MLLCHQSLQLCRTSQPGAKQSAGLGIKGKKWVLLARTAHNVFIKTIAFQMVKTMLAERIHYSECSDFLLKGREIHLKLI